jgi:hypothetical protein
LNSDHLRAQERTAHTLDGELSNNSIIGQKYRFLFILKALMKMIEGISDWELIGWAWSREDMRPRICLFLYFGNFQSPHWQQSLFLFMIFWMTCRSMSSQ